MANNEGLDPALNLRAEPRTEDADAIRALVQASGFFKPGEIAVAVELIEQRLRQGAASGYEFLFVETNAQMLGYACFGPAPLTESSFDLYWIVVDPHHQGQGVGMHLLACCEGGIRRAGGRQLYAETSSRQQYAPTRAFYRRAGFRQAAFLEDFYAPGDGKLIYIKRLV